VNDRKYTYTISALEEGGYVVCPRWPESNGYSTYSFASSGLEEALRYIRDGYGKDGFNL
jgi:hypothetical protein